MVRVWLGEDGYFFMRGTRGRWIGNGIGRYRLFLGCRAAGLDQNSISVIQKIGY
jgi:hypothetical protein